MRILKNFPRFLARQKFRFDLGQSFMSIINFAFVVIAASSTIATRVDISASALVLAAVPCAVLAVWVFGFTLDKIRFSQAYQEEQNQRNEMLREALGKQIPRP